MELFVDIAKKMHYVFMYVVVFAIGRLDRNSHPIESRVVGQPVVVKKLEKILYFIGNLHGPDLFEVFYSSVGLGFRADETICTTINEDFITCYTLNGAIIGTPYSGDETIFDGLSDRKEKLKRKRREIPDAIPPYIRYCSVIEVPSCRPLDDIT